MATSDSRYLDVARADEYSDDELRERFDGLRVRINRLEGDFGVQLNHEILVPWTQIDHGSTVNVPLNWRHRVSIETGSIRRFIRSASELRGVGDGDE